MLIVRVKKCSEPPGTNKAFRPVPCTGGLGEGDDWKSVKTVHLYGVPCPETKNAAQINDVPPARSAAPHSGAARSDRIQGDVTRNSLPLRTQPSGKPQHEARAS